MTHGLDEEDEVSDQYRPEGDVAAEAEAFLAEQADVDAKQAQAQQDEPVQEAQVQDETPTREQELEQLVDERTADLQRLQAEYVNYKKRVDRDRAQARQAGIESVVSELLPVLDSIEMARQHDDLAGAFKMVAEELEKVASKHGLSSFGVVGDPFDPVHHDALMQVPMDGVEVTTVSQVMQRGYSLHGRVIRPARVAVAEPH